MGEERPLVYFCTSHDWYGRQHFYQGLAQAFAVTRPVLYVSAAVAVHSRRRGHGDRVKGGYLSSPAPNLHVLEPYVPPAAHRSWSRPLRDVIVARAVTRAMRSLALDPENAVIWSYTSDAAALVRRMDSTSVYWTGDEVVDPMESKLLSEVDHVFTVSPAAFAEKRHVAGERVVAMPMAIDPQPLVLASRSALAPDDLAGAARPLAGYGGALSARIDWDLLDAFAAAWPGTVVLVGPAVDEVGSAGALRLARRANVLVMGHRASDDAPHYLASFDIGLIPYVRNAFNLGSNPVKAYEYLAAGRPVVSVSLPALEVLSPWVSFADTAQEFVERAVAMAADQAHESVAARQEMAEQFSYERLIQRVDQILGAPARVAPQSGLAR